MPLHGWRRAAAWAAPLAAALTGLAAGGYRLGQPPLWRDEAATKEIAGRSVPQILATLPHDDAVHGAYYILIHLVSGVLGTSFIGLSHAWFGCQPAATKTRMSGKGSGQSKMHSSLP